MYETWTLQLLLYDGNSWAWATTSDHFAFRDNATKRQQMFEYVCGVAARVIPYT